MAFRIFQQLKRYTPRLIKREMIDFMAEPQYVTKSISKFLSYFIVLNNYNRKFRLSHHHLHGAPSFSRSRWHHPCALLSAINRIFKSIRRSFHLRFMYYVVATLVNQCSPPIRAWPHLCTFSFKKE